MLNIQSAIAQMRIARRLGKISGEVQQRVLRRLAPRKSESQWQNLMALRANIAKEILPALIAKRSAELEVFDIAYETPKAKVKFSKRVVSPVIESLTPQWWKEAGERDKKALKAGILQDE